MYKPTVCSLTNETQLPAHLRTLETVGPFKTALKTYLHSIQWLLQIVSHVAPL